MDAAALAIGLPGALPAEAIRALAPRIEELGFRTLWLNDTPDGDALAGLAVAAAATTSLQLGTGVIPVDRRPASDIAAHLGGLPVERLTIGIGAGGPKRALDRVAAAVNELRGATAASIVVGALGPKMRALAVDSADGVLLNWLTPTAAAEARADAGGSRTILYVRAIADANALPQLQAEASRYDSSPSYAANLARIGARAIDCTIAGDLGSGIAAYRGTVDELVLRVITRSGSVEEIERFLEAAAAAS